MSHRYAIEVTSAAARDLRRLTRSIQRRIGARIDALADDPRPRGATKLAGTEALHRIRVGDYRIVYQIEDAILVVTVLRAGHRRDVYR